MGDQERQERAAQDASGAQGASGAEGGQVSANEGGEQHGGTGEAGSDELIPRSVMEAKLDAERRHWQSVADRQIAEARKQPQNQFQPPQQGQPYQGGQQWQQPVPPQPQQPQSDFSNDKFFELLDNDPAKAREYFFQHNSAQALDPSSLQPVVSQAVQQAMQQMQEQQSQQAQQQQYVQALDNATSSLTQQDRDRAYQYAVDYLNRTGTYCDPHEAVMYAQFGSPEQALQLARAQMQALGQQGSVPQQPNPQPPPPAQPGGPGIVGQGPQTNSPGGPPAPAGGGGEPPVKPGDFRKLLGR